MSTSMLKYANLLRAHYQRVWQRVPTELRWHGGPLDELPRDFSVLEFGPDTRRRMWTYATCGMSVETDENSLEIHLFSPVQATEHVELLTVIAHYHRTAARLGLGHTVNFGRPWLPGSHCSSGLISLPYLDGPDLEFLRHSELKQDVRFLWLIPITVEEVRYKKEHGLGSFENLLETGNVDYVDPLRKSLV